MSRNRWTRSLALLAVILLAGGCATRSAGELTALEQRVDRLERELDTAKRVASEAQRNAEAAALRADEAARTSEAIFAKRVSK